MKQANINNPAWFYPCPRTVEGEEEEEEEGGGGGGVKGLSGHSWEVAPTIRDKYSPFLVVLFWRLSGPPIHPLL